MQPLPGPGGASPRLGVVSPRGHAGPRARAQPLPSDASVSSCRAVWVDLLAACSPARVSLFKGWKTGLRAAPTLRPPLAAAGVPAEEALSAEAPQRVRRNGADFSGAVGDPPEAPAPLVPRGDARGCRRPRSLSWESRPRSRPWASFTCWS